MNSELSQNVAASLEGWYADHLSWHWLTWQYCPGPCPSCSPPSGPGVPREPVNTALLKQLDWFGLVYAMAGFGMLYAGLDQGNRLRLARQRVDHGPAHTGGAILSPPPSSRASSRPPARS